MPNTRVSNGWRLYEINKQRKMKLIYAAYCIYYFKKHTPTETLSTRACPIKSTARQVQIPNSTPTSNISMKNGQPWITFS